MRKFSTELIVTVCVVGLSLAAWAMFPEDTEKAVSGGVSGVLAGAFYGPIFIAWKLIVS